MRKINQGTLKEETVGNRYAHRQAHEVSRYGIQEKSKFLHLSKNGSCNLTSSNENVFRECKRVKEGKLPNKKSTGHFGIDDKWLGLNN